MSPVAYTLSFSPTAPSLPVAQAIEAVSGLGAVSMGKSSNQRFIVIDKLANLREFELLSADWRITGLAIVEPLNR
jgi:hypothetical protein